MAAFSFSTNWPTFHQDTTFFPPPPELLTFQGNSNFFSDTCINPLPSQSNHQSLQFNHQFSSFNNGNLSFHNPVRYPTLSSSSYSYMPPITTPHQRLPMSLPEFTRPSFTDNEFYSYPFIPNVFPMAMEQLQPELPPLPEIYQGVDSEAVMVPIRDSEAVMVPIREETSCVQVTKENGNGGERLSAQSMAARVRRRKISEKTLELGKLVPGGHRMNTAEMFQAAFKYVKFLQAQVAVLQLMDSSLEPGEELHDFITSSYVQEKLYQSEKCIVTRTLGESLIEESRKR